MTDKEMAFQIAEFILRQQVKDSAFTEVLDHYRLRGVQLDWQERVQQAQEQALSDPIFLDRISALKTAFDEAKPDDPLIRTLHRAFLFGYRSRP